MNFQFTEEQRLLANLARESAEKELRPKAAEVDYKAEIYWPHIRRMAELGFTGIAIPEADGGSGRTQFEVVLITEEIVRVREPTPEPALGEHRDAVLREKLGLAPADIERLEENGAFGR